MDNSNQQQQQHGEAVVVEDVIRIKNNETVTFEDIAFQNDAMMVRVTKIRKRSRYFLRSGRIIAVKSVNYKCRILSDNER